MAAPIQGTPETTQIDLESLERSLRRPRTLFSYTMSLLTGGATIAALFPLFSVLYMLVLRGSATLSLPNLDLNRLLWPLASPKFRS